MTFSRRCVLAVRRQRPGGSRRNPCEIVRGLPARRLLGLAAGLAAGLGPAHDLHAQQAEATTGVIRGTVTDDRGVPVADAVVVIRHLETGLRTVVESTSEGAFARALLPLGTYRVSVRSESNFGEIVREDLELHVGEVIDLDLSFQVLTLEGMEVLVDHDWAARAEDPSSSRRLDGEVVNGLPNNGRNYLDLAFTAPGVAPSQGPDGEVMSIGGQRGIFNNVMVDGADFNNPFFGEHRGGQRPAFTFNQEAIAEMVVVNQGAPAEYGRSAGGFVNVVTRSGTNEFQGSAHYFGQWDALAARHPRIAGDARPTFARNQFGATFGGPLVRDRAFFFMAFDRQLSAETKQTRRVLNNPSELAKLSGFLTERWPGLFESEFGAVERTDDARALTAKLDFALSQSHQLSSKYNGSWAEQVNGTFDVDSWGASANGVEQDYSHAVNVSVRSLLSSNASNEFRAQYAVEHRPRHYRGPLLPGASPPATQHFERLGGRPFPDIGMDFDDGFRIGMPFFLPVHPYHDDRVQILDNLSRLVGDHLLKAGIEYNRTSANQHFVGFANGRYLFDSVDGFINFVSQGNRFVTCSDGSSSAEGVCPAGSSITGPVLLFLQSSTVPGVPPTDLGLQTIVAHELAFFVQDSWKPRRGLNINLGLRWEGTWHPNPFVAPERTFYAPYLSDPRFPSDGAIPDDLDNFQPRFGLTWLADDETTVVRANAGAYFSRIPGLVFAQARSTNGAFQQTHFRSSADSPVLGPVPAIDELIDGSATEPFLPDIQVVSRDLELPRTWSFGTGLEHLLKSGLVASLSYQYAHTENLFRFVNRNHELLGSPFAVGTHPSGGGINVLTTAESSARSRYHGFTAGLRGENLGGAVAFGLSYTLAFDRSDDDNERDPFTFTYADPRDLDAEWGWSDRDRRHKIAGHLLLDLPGGLSMNHIARYLSASPVSESCVRRGERTALPSDRICADGSILERNGLRRDNEFFTWDLRVSRSFGAGQGLEVVIEAFNLTNSGNFLDPSQGSLLFNFDGAIRSGLGDSRRAQVGVRARF